MFLPRAPGSKESGCRRRSRSLQLVSAEFGGVEGVGAVDAPAGAKVGERPEVGEHVGRLEQFEFLPFWLNSDCAPTGFSSELRRADMGGSLTGGGDASWSGTRGVAFVSKGLLRRSEAAVFEPIRQRFSGVYTRQVERSFAIVGGEGEERPRRAGSGRLPPIARISQGGESAGRSAPDLETGGRAMNGRGSSASWAPGRGDRPRSRGRWRCRRRVPGSRRLRIV